MNELETKDWICVVVVPPAFKYEKATENTIKIVTSHDKDEQGGNEIHCHKKTDPFIAIGIYDESSYHSPVTTHYYRTVPNVKLFNTEHCAVTRITKDDKKHVTCYFSPFLENAKREERAFVNKTWKWGMN